MASAGLGDERERERERGRPKISLSMGERKPRRENWREKRNLGKIGIFPRLIGLPGIPSGQPGCPDSRVLS